jgi:hypothetical protein
MHSNRKALILTAGHADWDFRGNAKLARKASEMGK